MTAKLITTLAFCAITTVSMAQNKKVKKPIQQPAIETEKPEPDPVFIFVETLPKFPGGFEGFSNFKDKSLNTKKAEAPVTINVTFVVEKDGSLSEIRAIGRNEESNAAEEAIRVMKLSPKWEPGTQNGSPVRVQYTLPIIFN